MSWHNFWNAHETLAIAVFFFLYLSPIWSLWLILLLSDTPIPDWVRNKEF